MLPIEKYFCINEQCSMYGLAGEGNIVKCGKYSNNTRQLLQCNKCKKRFSEFRNTAFFNSKYSPDTIQAIIVSVAEGNGIRSTARQLGLSKDSVNNIVKKAGQHCELIMSNLLRSLNLDLCQMDELWSFIKKNCS